MGKGVLITSVEVTFDRCGNPAHAPSKLGEGGVSA